MAGLVSALAAQQEQFAELKRMFEGLKFAAAAALDDEAALVRAARAVDLGISAQRCPPYVASDVGRKTHVVVTRHTGSTPTVEWRAACGWKFGLAKHSFHTTPPPVQDRYEICWVRCAPRAASASDARHARPHTG